MSLKENIELWSQGVDLSQEGKTREAMEIWSSMQEPGTKILYNIASMHLHLGDLEGARKVSKSLNSKPA